METELESDLAPIQATQNQAQNLYRVYCDWTGDLDDFRNPQLVWADESLADQNTPNRRRAKSASPGLDNANQSLGVQNLVVRGFSLLPRNLGRGDFDKCLRGEVVVCLEEARKGGNTKADVMRADGV